MKVLGLTLSTKQVNILKELSKPNTKTGHHAKDRFDQRSIQSLIQKGFVEEYDYSLYLHGAVRLSSKGKTALGMDSTGFLYCKSEI